MYAPIRATTLKSAETMEIGVVRAPDSDHAEQLYAFLRYKGEPWTWQINECLAGRAGQLQTRFYIGKIKNEIACNVMTAEHLDVGILGHVFTAPHHRRKGACKAVMAETMNDFRQRGGKILMLGTGYDSPAYRIYQHFGFRSIVEKSGCMRYAADKKDERVPFSRSTSRVEDMGWRHWPLLSLLFMSKEGNFVRTVRFTGYGPSGFEGTFLHLKKNKIQAKVLVNEPGYAVGIAFVSPDPRWRGSTHILDFFVHPNFVDETAALLSSLGLPPGKIQAYAEERSHGKTEPLKSMGFDAEAVLKKQIQKDNIRLNVTVFSKLTE